MQTERSIIFHLENTHYEDAPLKSQECISGLSETKDFLTWCRNNSVRVRVTGKEGFY